MLATLRRNAERRTTPFGPDGQGGEPADCELCHEHRECRSRHGIVACKPCRARYLPRSTLL
ncbi:hypothetical protein [Haloarcula litorea]|uniref:hypothetical protein n=1 Tax=Haloarcula litorea TaxID=3032579 RepID=UPI0023E83B86|nr:hypothetical protein [Halomicroarcula sp. GDY20]